jgi:Peptide N-acetyl-beta-D-glucosaminyl asparaginase amidase A
MNLDNYIVGPYNGSFAVTLTIQFYTIANPPSEPAPDEIIPLSYILDSGVSTYFSLPNDETLTSISIAPNTSRLLLEVFASGNSQEEFWYSNVPDQYTRTFEDWNISLSGQGSFREVVVYIDDIPIGVVYPFEVVFTGGICPGFWRPIVGHRTFDLPSYTIDFTPFIGYLSHGSHTIAFAVQGQPNTLQNWYVSGHLRAWYSDSDNPYDNASLSGLSPTADITVVGSVADDNSSFSINTTALRKDDYYSIDYQNLQHYQLLENGTLLLQNLSQITHFATPLSTGYYNFSLQTSEKTNPDGTVLILANLSQTLHWYLNSSLDGAGIVEHAEVYSVGRLLLGKVRNLSQGNTSVLIRYETPRRGYMRDVRAVGLQVVSDYETDKLIGVADAYVGRFQVQDAK